MNVEKQRAFIIRFIYLVIMVFLIYVGIKYVLSFIMPFIIGMVIAMVFRKIIDKIQTKFKIQRAAVSIGVLLVFYVIIALALGLAGLKVISFTRVLFRDLPDIYTQTVLPAFNIMADYLTGRFPDIAPMIEDLLANFDESIFTLISSVSSSVVGMLTGVLKQVPSLLIKFVFTIVASFFFTIDYYRIIAFVIGQVKEENQPFVASVARNILATLGQFFKAYSSIIAITFVELTIGFAIAGVSTPYLFGALIALIDIMPVLGTGTVLVPWAVIALVSGNTYMGIVIAIIYGVITLVRQILEPKIVGYQIGLHPLVTLILMYVGARLMGLYGLLMLPIIATVLVKLDSEGSINLLHKKVGDS